MPQELTRRPGQLMQPQLATQELGDKFWMVLARPGVGSRKYSVTPGTMVSDLAKELKMETRNQQFWINRLKVDQNYVLQPRDVVFVVPEPKNA